MRTSESGLSLIKAHEGLRLESYLCPAGVWTIGYGHTDGTGPGRTCTLGEATSWLLDDIRGSEEAIGRLVTVPLTQGQFDALVSFTFNLGHRALGSSTLLRLLNDGLYAQAGAEFSRWVYAKGRKLAGLVARREAERSLFLGS